MLPTNTKEEIPQWKCTACTNFCYMKEKPAHCPSCLSREIIEVVAPTVEKEEHDRKHYEYTKLFYEKGLVEGVESLLADSKREEREEIIALIEKHTYDQGDNKPILKDLDTQVILDLIKNRSLTSE